MLLFMYGRYNKLAPMEKRDNFTKKIVDVLARRASYICSQPECKVLTISPSDTISDKFLYIGKAAHITAAAVGGPRYDDSLSPKERGAIENAIFLCSSCADMIDKNNGADFSTCTLIEWKLQHEAWVRRNLNKSIFSFGSAAISLSVPSDRLLFAKLLEQFPYNSHMMYLLRDNDVANPFPAEWLKDINSFTQEWNDASHEFIDPKLEGKRKDFMVKLTSFENGLWSITWKTENGDLSVLSHKFKEEDPRWEKINELNAMGTEVHNAHQELVRACKAKLGDPEVS